MTPDPQTSEPQDSLHLDRCPDCGYPLTGLPPVGRCPECGFGYTQGMIVVYVWPSGTGPGTRHWWLVSLLAPIVCLSVLQSARLIWGNPAGLLPDDFVGVLILIGTIAPTIVLISMHRLLILWGRAWIHARRDSPPAPLQVRMTPQGYATRCGFGQVKLKPWTSGHQLWLQAIPGGRYDLAIQDGGVHVWDLAGGCQLNCDLRTADRIRQRVQTWCDHPADRHT